MVNFQPYSRTVLRDLRHAWLRRHLWFVIGAISITAGFMIAMTALITLTSADNRAGWYLLGIVHAAMVSIVLYGMQIGFLLQDPDGIRQLRGAYGEENTRTELRTARRRRLIWGWVDSITLERGDLDHVVVTRRGGVLAIDSKWRNGVDGADLQAMVAAAGKVRLRAEHLTRQLLSSERGARHRAYGGSVTVRPVVVIWGAEQQRLPKDGACIGGIDFVAGSHLRRWLRRLDAEPVAKEAGTELLDNLDKFRAASARTERERRSLDSHP